MNQNNRVRRGSSGSMGSGQLSGVSALQDDNDRNEDVSSGLGYYNSYQGDDNITDYTKAAKRTGGGYSLAERIRMEEEASSQDFGSLEGEGEEEATSPSPPTKSSPPKASSITPTKASEEIDSSATRPATTPDGKLSSAMNKEHTPIEPRDSNAAKNWAKIRLANKMAVAFKGVNEDIQKFGANANDEHIDWKEVYKGNDKGKAMNDAGKWVIDPHGSFRISWDIFMSFILLYIAFYVPYRVCLYWDDDATTSGMQVLEYGSDVLFGIDIILNFFTAYHDRKTGLLVTDTKKIAWHYFRTFFFIDLIASFPFGLVLDNSAKTLNKGGKVMRLPRLIKFLRLMRLLKLVRVIRLRQFVSRFEHDFSIHHGISRMVKIIFVVFLVTHLVGCLWFMIGRTGGEGEIDGGWQWRYQMTNHSLEAQYVTSLYWAFSTLTTVGYGDISARTPQEQIYSMLMMLLGVSWYAYIVSSMSTIMGSFDRQNKAMKEKMNSVNAFIQDAKLPMGTAKQIRRYYDFALTANKNKSLLNSNMYNADAILEELSSGLRAEILLFVERQLISKIPFLKDKIPQFVADVITMFQPMVFQEGDFIIKEGSAADEMYFLIKGRCAVYYGNKRVVSITEGSYFGEVGCIMGGIRRAGIKALTLCELQALARRNLNILLAEYPDVGDELKKVAHQRANQVRNSTVQKKQVAGIRKMLAERDKFIQKSPKSPGRKMRNLQEEDSRGIEESPGRKKEKSNIDKLVKKSAQNNSNSGPVVMTRGMSITSGFGKQGTGGGARDSSQFGSGSELNSQIQKTIDKKSDDANAKLLAKMEAITNSFMNEA